MRRLIWAVIAYLVTVTSIGAYFYQPHPSPHTAYKQTIIELALNDHVERILQYSTGVPEGDLLILQTLNLRGLTIPPVIEGVVLRVLTQEEIDVLSRAYPVNYMFFDRITKVDPDTAEVELIFTWRYQVDSKLVTFGQHSGITYYCSQQSGEWVISSAGAWVP
jgi:hypothetical protein